MSDRLIRNCKFRFRCTRQWQLLDETEAPSIRFCGECRKKVYLCETDVELIEALQQNRCVAMFDESDTEYPTLLGDVELPYSATGKLKQG